MFVKFHKVQFRSAYVVDMQMRDKDEEEMRGASKCTHCNKKNLSLF